MERSKFSEVPMNAESKMKLLEFIFLMLKQIKNKL